MTYLVDCLNFGIISSRFFTNPIVTITNYLNIKLNNSIFSNNLVSLRDELIYTIDKLASQSDILNTESFYILTDILEANNSILESNLLITLDKDNNLKKFLASENGFVFLNGLYNNIKSHRGLILHYILKYTNFDQKFYDKVVNYHSDNVYKHDTFLGKEIFLKIKNINV